MCTRITDRNGNYIGVTYNGAGPSIDTITDTAGRVIKFGYDPTYYTLGSIALQTGPSTYRTLATFSYVNNTLGLNFAGLGIVNAWHGMTYPVLRRITRYDGYFWEFDHSCYGQVNRFRRNPVNSTSTSQELVEIFYDVAYNTTAAQSDCPRFTTRYLQGYEVQPGNGNWVRNGLEINLPIPVIEGRLTLLREMC